MRHVRHSCMDTSYHLLSGLFQQYSSDYLCSGIPKILPTKPEGSLLTLPFFTYMPHASGSWILRPLATPKFYPSAGNFGHLTNGNFPFFPFNSMVSICMNERIQNEFLLVSKHHNNNTQKQKKLDSYLKELQIKKQPNTHRVNTGITQTI